jgi:hypothetical protein
MFALLLTAACGLLHWRVPEALAATGALLFAAKIATRHSISGATVVADLRGALGKVSAELLLVVACSALAVLASGVLLPASAANVIGGVVGGRLLGPALILFVMPLVTVFGVHPLILFNVCFPIFDVSMTTTPAHRYLLWTSMFLIAQLVSPVSISAVIAAASVGEPPERTSYSAHARYAAAFGLCAWCYLAATQ